MSLTDIHFRFEARSLQRLHKVPILSPILIWVRSGTKRMHTLLRLDLARPWQAAEIAAQLGMSESTMRRGLRHEGTSFRQLLAELRLVEAFGLVMCSRHTLQEIAFDCGFQSPSRFSQNFRHFFGMSPSELRASQEKQGV